MRHADEGLLGTPGLVLVLFLIFQRQFIQGIALGGMK